MSRRNNKDKTEATSDQFAGDNPGVENDEANSGESIDAENLERTNFATETSTESLAAIEDAPAQSESFADDDEDGTVDTSSERETDAATSIANAQTDTPSSPEIEEDDEDEFGAATALDAFASNDAEEGGELNIFDADAEDEAELDALRRRSASMNAAGDFLNADGEIAPGGGLRDMAEMIAIIEALIFVSEEPLLTKTIADLLKEERGWIQVAVEELAKEFNERNGGLMLREVAGGWQFATRPEYHEHVRAYLKSRPSAKLSLAALETLAVIAYKQPITVPEILEIRGVQSSSAIKTLLDKRLIIAKGRKETVGRPMMYGTSKEFLLQFGLKDLTELPNVEDFEDLTTGVG